MYLKTFSFEYRVYIVEDTHIYTFRNNVMRRCRFLSLKSKFLIYFALKFLFWTQYMSREAFCSWYLSLRSPENNRLWATITSLGMGNALLEIWIPMNICKVYIFCKFFSKYPPKNVSKNYKILKLPWYTVKDHTKNMW